MQRDAVAVDCEMVTTRYGEAVAQVCVVNAHGRQLLLSYVSPSSPVVDYKTPYSGIERHHLVGAPSLADVTPRIVELMRCHLVVGHSVTHDLDVLSIRHRVDPADVRDTADLPRLLNGDGRSRKLKDLALEHLGVRIQNGPHCPLEDAATAMRLYKACWNLPGAAPRRPVPVITCWECGRSGHKKSTCPYRHNPNDCDDPDDYDDCDLYEYGPGAEGADGYDRNGYGRASW